MNTDELTRINHKSYINDASKNDNKKIKYLKNLITRVLLSIILILSVSIFAKISNDNILLINRYFFEDSLKFTKINNWYQNNVGKIIPQVKNESSLVFNSEDLKKNSYVKYLDGVKINVDKTSPISLLMGGIIVFIGEKEGYGNTLILQGNDGIDYWYGGITNLNVNLYDYLETNSLIGEAKDNYLYLVLQKDGKYIDYEEFFK